MREEVCIAVPRLLVNDVDAVGIHIKFDHFGKAYRRAHDSEGGELRWQWAGFAHTSAAEPTKSIFLHSHKAAVLSPAGVALRLVRRKRPYHHVAMRRTRALREDFVDRICVGSCWGAEDEEAICTDGRDDVAAGSGEHDDVGLDLGDA